MNSVVVFVDSGYEIWHPETVMNTGLSQIHGVAWTLDPQLYGVYM